MYVCGKVFRQMKHCLSALHHPAFNLTHGGTGSKRMTFAGVSRAGRDRLEEALGIEGSARPRFAPCALKVGWERKKGGANSCGRKQIISKLMRRAHSFLWFRTLWEGGGRGGGRGGRGGLPYCYKSFSPFRCKHGKILHTLLHMWPRGEALSVVEP